MKRKAEPRARSKAQRSKILAQMATTVADRANKVIETIALLPGCDPEDGMSDDPFGDRLRPRARRRPIPDELLGIALDATELLEAVHRRRLPDSDLPVVMALTAFAREHLPDWIWLHS